MIRQFAGGVSMFSLLFLARISGGAAGIGYWLLRGGAAVIGYWLLRGVAAVTRYWLLVIARLCRG